MTEAVTLAGHDYDVVTSDGVNIRHPTSDWKSRDVRWPRSLSLFFSSFPTTLYNF